MHTQSNSKLALLPRVSPSYKPNKALTVPYSNDTNIALKCVGLVS